MFDQLSVRENLVLAASGREATAGDSFSGRAGAPRSRTPAGRRSPWSGWKGGSCATSSLSFGDKRKLEISLALSLRPSVLLLDEPFAGLSDAEIGEVLELIHRFKTSFSLVIIEHKISRIVDLVSRLSVMHEGKLIAEGDPKKVIEEPLVRQVYWGRA